MACTVNGCCWRAATNDARRLSRGSVKNFRWRCKNVTVKKSVPHGLKARRYCAMIVATKGGMRCAFPPYGDYGNRTRRNGA